MANMSYCRFENTYRDFADCLNVLCNREIDSKDEKLYAKMLFELAQEYIDEFEEYMEENELGKEQEED